MKSCFVTSPGMLTWRQRCCVVRAVVCVCPVVFVWRLLRGRLPRQTSATPTPTRTMGAGPRGPELPYPHSVFFTVFSADDDLARIQAARSRVADETRTLEERLLIRRAEAARMRDELKALGIAVVPTR